MTRFMKRGCLTVGCAACGYCFAPKEEIKMTEKTHIVSTDALATLGTIIDETAGRDAIHLAVEPVIAGEKLNPGQDVGIRDGKAYGARPYVGIVDPFLSSRVLDGQRFWLVVYPRTITSLRHVWEHPSFPTSVAVAAPKTDKDASVIWMTNWAIRHMSADYYGDYNSPSSPISPEAALGNAIAAGRDMSVGPYESARDHINNEWWDHWEAITGERGSREEYFSCAC